MFIRCLEHTLELFINTGSVLDGDAGENTTVRVRWGTDAPEEQTWSRSTDYEAAFAPDPAAFMRLLVAMPDMRFEFHPFDATPRVATFDARGLAKHLPLVTAACPSISETPPASDSVRSPVLSGDPVFTTAVVEEQPERLSAPKVQYPTLLRDAGIQGRVMVEAIIDTTGHIENNSIKILSSPNPGFNPGVIDALRRSVFRPARVHGRAVRVLIQVPYDFNASSH